MSQKRLGSNDDNFQLNSSTNASEILGAATETARTSIAAPEKKDEEKISLFWRVFGGTILSIITLVGITLYNAVNGNIVELRNELHREREIRAELAKKEDVDTRLRTQYERIRAVEGFRADIEALRERSNTNAAAVDTLKKDTSATLDGLRKEHTAIIEGFKKDSTATTDMLKKETATLDALRERIAALDGLRKEVAELGVLKLKIETATTELKGLRDDLKALQQDVDRNKVADIERKNARDMQMKQLDDVLKEIQKGLQESRDRMSRLEGAQQPITGPALPVGVARPGKQNPELPPSTAPKSMSDGKQVPMITPTPRDD